MKKLAKAVKLIRTAPRWEKVYLCGDALEQVLRWAAKIERRLDRLKTRV